MHAGLSAWPALLRPSTWLKLTHIPRLIFLCLILVHPLYSFPLGLLYLTFALASAVVNLNACGTNARSAAGCLPVGLVIVLADVLLAVLMLTSVGYFMRRRICLFLPSAVWGG